MKRCSFVIGSEGLLSESLITLPIRGGDDLLYFNDVLRSLADYFHGGSNSCESWIVPSCSTYGTCFNCGECDHWKLDCPWLHHPCVKGCGQTMKVKGFKWFDEALAELMNVESTPDKMKGKNEVNMEEGKLKFCIGGPVKMQIEGNVSDVTQLIKNLSLLN
ncbi:hypothetical protein IFM89_035226 [Coptis chinensis]|uniref:CCHC-type domain-containing protein n=1 Tax=Coptis chinensis TaxID=261450 RepID=A0A835IJ01_9MAGN|nr:hypothetical protein IFM89_035226 [Coptis chinensis]